VLEIWAMNLLLGIIVGVLLTIGTAFIADAFTTAEGDFGSVLQADRELEHRKRAPSRNYRLN
jgi:hypothetical protein